MARTTERNDAGLALPEAGQVVTVSSTRARNARGHLLDRVARRARVVVTRDNRRQAVILSAEEYDALLAEEAVDLSTLEREGRSATRTGRREPISAGEAPPHVGRGDQIRGRSQDDPDLAD